MGVQASDKAMQCSVTSIETEKPLSAASKSHHEGSPPTSFKNPWPSFSGNPGLWDVLNVRFGPDRNFVPVPAQDELVQVQKPDWGGGKHGLKATWIGHATFLVETISSPDAARGVRVLFDPVFSDRTGPYGMVGPKRYNPVPCPLEDLPEVDIVVISHNHYDHLDLDTLSQLRSLQNGKLKVLCGLGNKSNFLSSGFVDSDVIELDWWDGVEVQVSPAGKVNIVCTPAQHFSGRGIFDRSKGLWCSWVLQEVESFDGAGNEPQPPHRLYFAGDTGYRHIPRSTSPEDEEQLPHCPAFKEIGDLYGPFDLALLPIGLYSPRYFSSNVHCAPEETLCIHKDVRSKKSIGMHYGTVRGGLSAQFEDVREPPRRWREVCEKNELKWGVEVGLCNIGETVCIP